MSHVNLLVQHKMMQNWLEMTNLDLSKLWLVILKMLVYLTQLIQTQTPHRITTPSVAFQSLAHQFWLKVWPLIVVHHPLDHLISLVPQYRSLWIKVTALYLDRSFRLWKKDAVLHFRSDLRDSWLRCTSVTYRLLQMYWVCVSSYTPQFPPAPQPPKCLLAISDSILCNWNIRPPKKSWVSGLCARCLGATHRHFIFCVLCFSQRGYERWPDLS